MITQSKHRWLLQGAFVITTAFSFSSDWLSWKVTRVVLINHKAKWNKTKEILIHFWHLNKNHFTSDFLKTYLPSNRYFWYFSSRETFCHFGNLLAFLAKVEVRNFHTTNKWRKSNQELYENRLETRKRPNKEITEAGSVVQENKCEDKCHYMWKNLSVFWRLSVAKQEGRYHKEPMKFSLKWDIKLQWKKSWETKSRLVSILHSIGRKNGAISQDQSWY